MGHVNLYGALGVGRSDCAVAVRRAYRDLARLSNAATESVPAFVQGMEIAVAVLSDGARRARYDRVADPPMEELASPPSLDLLGDFQGGPPSTEEVWDAFRRNFAAGAEPKSGRVEALDLWLRTAAPVEEIDHLTTARELRLRVPVFHACATCHGTGSAGWSACAACDGTGFTEERTTMRLPVSTPGPHLVPLDEIGVRSPILRLHVELVA